MAYTKEERAAYMKKYREEHREELNANRRYNRQRHPERAKAVSKAYYERHKNDPEYKKRAKENTKRWIANNRDYWNAYCKDYRLRKAEQDLWT